MIETRKMFAVESFRRVVMPKIYRAMKRDGESKPVIEATAKGLGVRPEIDVDLDELGRVMLNNKGMSVAPSWRDLPPHRFPTRLRKEVRKARGANDTSCFRMGEGNFSEGDLASGLELKLDRPTHGVVAPGRLISLEGFQSDLAATRELWTIEEE